MANKDFKVKNGIDIQSPLPVTMGGTGQTTANNTLNALLPSQVGNASKVLSTDGTSTTWVAQSVAYQRGGTASRPGSPTIGDLYYNTDNNYFESYTANGWFPIAAAPSAPTGVTATNQPTGRAYNNGQMSVSFTPNSGGGAPTSFIVTPSPTTSPTTFTGSSSPITVTGLASSTQYTYTVQSTSPYGTSSASSASSGVTATTVPDAPTSVSATSGENTQSVVSWTAGATGGSAITGYVVTPYIGATAQTATTVGNVNSTTITGLTNDTAYTFKVAAINANGTGNQSSASSSVTPLDKTYIIGTNYSTTWIKSSDAITWTTVTIPSDATGTYFSAAKGAGLYVFMTAGGDTKYVTSPDGTTWTKRTRPIQSSNTRGLIYGDKFFFFGGWDNDSAAAYSTDGITWTTTTTSQAKRWNMAAYSGSTYAMVSGRYDDYSNVAGSSTNAISWTSRTLPTTANWGGIVYGNSKFVANSTESSNGGNNYSATSDDGINWGNLTTISAGYAQNAPVVFNGSIFIIGAFYNGYFYTSTDGITWTQRARGSLNPQFFYASNGSKTIGFLYNSSTYWYSSDGINYTQSTLPATEPWYVPIYG